MPSLNWNYFRNITTKYYRRTVSNIDLHIVFRPFCWTVHCNTISAQSSIKHLKQIIPTKIETFIFVYVCRTQNVYKCSLFFTWLCSVFLGSMDPWIHETNSWTLWMRNEWKCQKTFVFSNIHRNRKTHTHTVWAKATVWAQTLMYIMIIIWSHNEHLNINFWNWMETMEMMKNYCIQLLYMTIFQWFGAMDTEHQLGCS